MAKAKSKEDSDIKNTLGNTLTSTLASALNDEQRSAVEHGEGPLLVIAGAGTGKTRVISHRIAHLINEGVRPSEILALTFTEKAASEMEERVDRLVPYGYTSVELSTFHAFGDSLLRDNALSIGIVPDFKVLTQAECVVFLKEKLFELPLSYYRPSGNPTRYLLNLISLIGRLKDEDVTPEEYVAFATSLTTEDNTQDYIDSQLELSKTYSRYQELMAAAGFIDFGDQVTMALRLIREKEDVLKRVRERFKYVLADEFQDTNYAQFEMLKLVVGEKRNITVVADDDQSIYKFRGAAISNVLNFKDVYPDAKEVTLIKNYRSLQPILDTSYRLIQNNNPDRLEVKSGIDKRLVSTRDDAVEGKCVEHLHFDTHTSEAEAVAEAIEREVKEGRRSLKDFAILVRSNNIATAFLKALSLRGIPYTFSGNKGLYAREEVRLLINMLQAVTDFSGNLPLFSLATSEVYAVKAADLVPCHNKARRENLPLISVMKEAASGGVEGVSEEGKASLSALVKDIEKYSETALKASAGNLIYLFLTETGYIKKLSAKDTLEAEEKVRNIARFFEIVTHIEETLPVSGVTSLIEHLNVMMDAGDDPATAEADVDDDAVSVMTIHKSKGLEFPVVYMVSLVSDKFPTRKRGELLSVPAPLIKDTLPEGDFHLEEERRLFYVGMTRAMEKLYLTSAADYGGVRAKKVSVFVQEALDVEKAKVQKASAMEAIARHAPVEEAPGQKNKGLPPIAEDKVLRLSFYQIDDYDTCPFKFRYVHVLRVPLLPHHSIMYGKAVHEAISFYLLKKHGGVTPPLEDVLSVYRAHWSSMGFISREHEEKRLEDGEAALKRFVEGEGLTIKPAAVEKDFTVDFGSFELRGRWDLIEEREDGAYIVDFKTSDVRDAEKARIKARDSMQLKLYALAYENIFGEMPKGCELHFVESGLVGSAAYKDKAMEKAREVLERVSSGIRARDYTPKPNQFTCSFCAFGDICEARFGS